MSSAGSCFGVVVLVEVNVGLSTKTYAQVSFAWVDLNTCFAEIVLRDSGGVCRSLRVINLPWC